MHILPSCAKSKSLFALKGDLLGSRAGEASGIGLVMSWDSRDSIFFPRQGKYCQTYAKFFGRYLKSDYLFQRFNINYRQYFPFFSSHALAVQATINVITGKPAFQMLSLLGGQSLMRGYYRGRYRDKDMIAVQLEYRMPVWRRLGLVGFFGCGDVSDRLSQFRLESFKMTGGVGARYRIQRQQGSNLRLDLGFSRESSGVYVTVNEAF
jgi:outer membrane protein assembly factor BamA